MAVVRRQSGRLLPPPVHLDMAEKDGDEQDAYMEEEYNSDLAETEDSESSDDSGSDWAKPSRKSPVKRAKTSASKPPKKTGKDRAKPNLSLLPTMPLDVLYEIFSRLEPADLLSLARTSKNFRKTLMSRKAASIWKAARRQMLGVPTCPSDVSEPRWANLLFGGSKCQVCGTSGVQRVDFALRRRCCTRCLRENLMYSVNFKKKFPDFDVAILDLIPHTNIGAWAGSRPSSSKFYWESDIYAMAKTLGTYEKDIHMRKPGAKNALDNFKATRKEHVRSVQEHVARCRSWVRSAAGLRANEIMQRKQERCAAIEARFIALGYLSCDLSIVRHSHEADNETELTDRIWGRIRPILEPKVIESKQRRIAKERREVIQSRQRVVEKLYNDYKKTLIPSQVAYLPRSFDLFQIAEFAALLNEESNSALQEADFVEQMEKLLEHIVRWREQKQLQLMELLPAANRIFPSASGHSTSNIDCLALATSVFTCDCRDMLNTPYFHFSWNEAVSHGCATREYGLYGPQIPTNTKLNFTPRGSMAAAFTVKLLGLDEWRAVPSDLDKSDARFVCLDCPVRTRSAMMGRPAMSWRACVAHFLANNPTDHVTPRWECLDPQATSDVKKREGPDPAENDKAWSCNHCSVYLDNFDKRQPIVLHVQTTHNIDHPREGSDFFYNPGMRRPLPHEAMYGQKVPPNDGARYRCLKCPSTSTRTFIFTGVRDHLRAKHSVQVPVPGVDMAKA